MKKIRWLIFVLTFFLGVSTEVVSQSAPTDFQVLATINPADTNYVFGDTLFYTTNHYAGTAILTLVDTTTIKKIDFYFGSTDSTWNLISKAFTFDSTGTFLDGTSYYRNGFNVYLGLGNYSGQDSIFSKVILQDTGGHFSSPIFFNQAISNSSVTAVGIDTTIIIH